jgi:uncharacterized membrane protein YfcA
VPFALYPLLVAPLSGSVVGFSLALVGGGGSLLAVPLLVHLVGVSSVQTAIGTSAIAVAANAAVNLFAHIRLGGVKWRCAGVFGATGAAGAWLGSSLGKQVDGNLLLLGFSALMFATVVVMARRSGRAGDPDVLLKRENARTLLPRLLGLGLGTGVLAGFFGIGGGFVIVPGLMLATGMPILNAVGSSLFVIATFGTVTAANYAVSGMVDWRIAALFLIGGTLGGLFGTALASHLSRARHALTLAFTSGILLVAVYTFISAARGLLAA